MRNGYINMDGEARRSWRSVAGTVAGRMTLAVGGITILGGLLLVLGVLLASRHEFQERGLDPNAVMAQQQYGAGMMVVDSRKALLFVVMLMVGITVAVGVTGWYFLRREIKPMERALRLQRDFVADASHELKTPLAVLGTRLDLIEFRRSKGEDIAEPLRQLRGDVDRMNAIVTDLLVVARDGVSTEPVDVSAAIEDAVAAVRPLADCGNVGLRVVVDDAAANSSSWIVEGGAVGICRCLVAVLDNAVAHSPDDGEVTIRLTRERRRGRDMVATYITDQGGGVGPDSGRLFRRFTRDDDGTSHQGYGLGLAIARDVADRYGGDIDVASSSSEGTTMRIAFPSAER